jgi:hypothetical protein
MTTVTVSLVGIHGGSLDCLPVQVKPAPDDMITLGDLVRADVALLQWVVTHGDCLRFSIPEAD